MRAALLLALVGCTPEVVPGSYFCGPDASCPEGQHCNEADNTCVLAGRLMPFECEADVASEPDDSAETGYTLANLDCTTLPIVIDSCMFMDDPADWVRLPIPASCGTISIDARITFPIAFQQLGLSLIDTSSGAELAADTTCTFNGDDGGDQLRCLAASLTAGVTYAIGVAPTGEGDCDGDCAFNRYTLRAQLK